MAERETIEKVKDRQGILSRIQNALTLGYGTKEDLRELDRKLRDYYYEDFRSMRHSWEDVYSAIIEIGYTASSTNLKKVIQVLDRVMEKVRHADYGYAGLMDRKGHIREQELARVLKYDQSLGREIESLKEAIDKASNEAEAENWASILAEAKKVKNLLLAFEKSWRERESHFRPLEI